MAAIKNALIIDAGNTHIKVAHFSGNTLRSLNIINLADTNLLSEYIEEADYCIISSVSVSAESLKQHLSPLPCIIFSAETPLPFKNNYQTPTTLGPDRLAGIAGAMFRFRGKPTLVIDSGTCITYDVLTSEGVYVGGAISPGLHMRLQAMQTFTQRLPLPDWHLPETFTGNNTADCLLAGAYFGLADEINGRIGRYEQRYSGLQTLLCGGDAGILQKQLKNNIFVAPNLVLEGLNQILYFNVK
jgi:type III pantothenate kinase